MATALRFGIVLFFGRGFTRFSGLVKRLDTKVESHSFGSVPLSCGSCEDRGVVRVLRGHRLVALGEIGLERLVPGVHEDVGGARVGLGQQPADVFPQRLAVTRLQARVSGATRYGRRRR